MDNFLNTATHNFNEMHLAKHKPVRLIGRATFFPTCLLCSIILTFLCSSCEKKASLPPSLFQKIDPAHTNIDFRNDLAYDAKFNIYTYRNFYNGGGVAIGDVNNDGLQDLFFTANMLPNRLYLNKGNLEFEDITEKAGIVKKGKWSTGVSMADVNGDGFLDIYVCNSGDIKGDHKDNELYINNGNGTFSEKASEYGLADKGLSTHAAFFDYDHDGDLDMFLLNNSFKAIGSFNHQNNEREQRDPQGGDKLYRNDGSIFTDVSEQAGIYGSIIGFGLGVTVGDVNKDGWQDIYVSNDFFERDYLYLNQQDGTFAEVLKDQMMSISNASMGADMADINNDQYPDLFVTEMLPESEARIKTNTTFESWDKYQLSVKHDYYHQFTRNMLQLNNGNNTFSEISRFAGVAATDWSWGALITDLDNDGYKDIFVANGIYQDLTNRDYIQFISNEEFFKEVTSGKADFKQLIDLIPSQALPNYAFRNKGGVEFENQAKEWGLGEESFSNGSAYGDLDNDGDLDLVVNNVNMACFVYRNESNRQKPDNKYLRVVLEGEAKNRFGVGAQVSVYYNQTLSYQEQMPTRGFESSVDPRLSFGLGKATKIDSLVVQWTSGKRQVVRDVLPNQQIVLQEKQATFPGAQSNTTATNTTAGTTPVNPIFTPLEEDYGLGYIHQENEFVDFDRDPLLFHMLSRQGPHITKGDVNGDGLEDVFVGGAKDQAGGLFVQTKAGKFIRSNQALLDKDKVSEDVDALFFDCDGDQDLDLYVCSGGNEFSANSPALLDRLYLNNGKGTFWKSSQVLPSYQFESSSCVRGADFDQDGDVDLFVGVRLKPFRYGYPCRGYVLENNGQGLFTDVTDKVAPELKQAGMVTDAQWVDFDQDQQVDLVVVGEYMPVRVLQNRKGRLQEVTQQVGLHKSNGWWNRIQIADVNQDTYPDLIISNHGENSRFKATLATPVQMYVNDFDNNGRVEQIITTYPTTTTTTTAATTSPSTASPSTTAAKAYPMVLRHDLVSVLPSLKKKYLKYQAYKEQTMEDIFSQEQLKEALTLQAFTLQSSIFINKSGESSNQQKSNQPRSNQPRRQTSEEKEKRSTAEKDIDKQTERSFEQKALPWQAQLSPVYAIQVADFTGDQQVDILLGGNFYQAKPEAGIYDASFGLLLKGNGNGAFVAVPPKNSGINLRGPVRDIMEIKVGQENVLLFALNDEPLKVFSKRVNGNAIAKRKPGTIILKASHTKGQ